MGISPLAGKPAPQEMLVDLAKLEREYYEHQPDMTDANQRVSFGTSGHRGSSLRGTFTEAHILAITQAICDHRRRQGIDSPLYLGKDTHGLSGPAQRTALEVLAANQVGTIIQRNDGVTPTPVISWAILVYNRGHREHLADGIVVTPSHNPPEDGGFKYNSTGDGPANVTGFRGTLGTSVSKPLSRPSRVRGGCLAQGNITAADIAYCPKTIVCVNMILLLLLLSESLSAIGSLFDKQLPPAESQPHTIVLQAGLPFGEIESQIVVGILSLLGLLDLLEFVLERAIVAVKRMRKSLGRLRKQKGGSQEKSRKHGL